MFDTALQLQCYTHTPASSVFFSCIRTHDVSVYLELHKPLITSPHRVPRPISKLKGGSLSISNGYRNFERVGQKLTYQPRCHLSQMHTTNYMLFKRERTAY